MRRSGYVLIGFAVLLMVLVITISPDERQLEEEPELGERNPFVLIYDSTFTTVTDNFPTCPVTIGIKTLSGIGSYDVKIERYDGSSWQPIATLGTNIPGDGTWHPFTYTCTLTGDWMVKAGPVNTHFGTGTFFVIPEVPLGAITALAACFAGLGVRRIWTKK